MQAKSKGVLFISLCSGQLLARFNCNTVTEHLLFLNRKGATNNVFINSKKRKSRESGLITEKFEISKVSKNK